MENRAKAYEALKTLPIDDLKEYISALKIFTNQDYKNIIRSFRNLSREELEQCISALKIFNDPKYIRVVDIDNELTKDMEPNARIEYLESLLEERESKST